MTSIIRPEWSNFPISLFHGMSHFEVNSSFHTILAIPVVLVQICRNIFFTFFHFSVIWNNFWPFVTPNNNNNKQNHLCCFLFFSSHFFIFRSFEFAACHSRRPTRRPILRSLGVARQPPVRLGEYTNWDKNDGFRHSCVISKSIEIGLGLNEVPSSDIKAGRMMWKRGISHFHLIFDWSSESGWNSSGVTYTGGWMSWLVVVDTLLPGAPWVANYTAQFNLKWYYTQ